MRTHRADAAALILAAGKSTRMRSRTPKTLHKVRGKAILFHILDALARAGVERRIVVIGHEADLVRQAVAARYGQSVGFALQAEQLGTGHAVRVAEGALADHDGPTLVLPGDTPLLSTDTLRQLIDAHAGGATLLTAQLPDAGAYGRIVRESDGQVAAIVEARDATPEQRALREINAGVYAFDTPALFAALRELRPENAQGEYYLTDVVKLFRRQGLPVAAVVSDDPEVTLGVNTRVELADVDERLRRRLLHALMLSGVTVVDPGSTFVDADVTVGQDTILLPGTHLQGNTRVGENCILGPYVVVTDAAIGDGCKVGPFAHVRPGSRLGARVKLGNFVEINRSTLADGVSAAHLTYLGDATVGERANIGAGTITCNYDGFEKFPTTIGAEAFIGSHSTLIAPLTVGERALTAAGSVITRDVADDALAVARERQTTMEGREAARRRKRAAEVRDKRSGA